MNKRELCSILQNQTMNPKRLRETQEMCSALIEEQRKLDILRKSGQISGSSCQML